MNTLLREICKRSTHCLVFKPSIENLRNRLWTYYDIIFNEHGNATKMSQTVEILYIFWYIIPYKFSLVFFFLLRVLLLCPAICESEVAVPRSNINRFYDQGYQI
jgi:hypothetical protein